MSTKYSFKMRLIVFGSGDFAPTVVALTRDCGHEPVGLVDDFIQGGEILGTLEDAIRSHPPSSHGIVLAIGYKDLSARWKAWERLRVAGYAAPALVHPRAYVADTARLGAGCMVMAGAIVDARAEVGEATVLWPSACINHDTRIGSNCFVSPNATVCGFANVGPNSFVGAGAVIADNCEVPASSFIKMLARYSERRLP